MKEFGVAKSAMVFLDKGQRIKLISKRMKLMVELAYKDHYVMWGVDGTELAQITEIVNKKQFENMVKNIGFNECRIFY